MTVSSSLHQFLHRIKGIKIKTDIINEDNLTISFYMVSIVEILCVFVQGENWACLLTIFT